MIHYLESLKNRGLPSWTYQLSAEQCRIFLRAIVAGFQQFRRPYSACSPGIASIVTSSRQMVSDLSQLCLHSGYSSRSWATQTGYKIDIHYQQIAPEIGSVECQEKLYDYKGPVYCLSVPSEVFMVRNNGKCVWTGNSVGHVDQTQL